jgi:hypothetical protein
MAGTPDTTPAAKGPSRSTNFGFLTHKLGPLPVWAYALIAAGIYYWYTHYGPGANKSATGGGKGQAGTDPTTNQPYAWELGRAQERINLLQSEKTGRGHIGEDHDRAQKGAPGPIYAGTEQSGSPNLPAQPEVNAAGPMLPPGEGHKQHEGGQDRGNRQVVMTRWRGVPNQKRQAAPQPVVETKPAHRPLGV